MKDIKFFLNKKRSKAKKSSRKIKKCTAEEEEKRFQQRKKKILIQSGLFSRINPWSVEKIVRFFIGLRVFYCWKVFEFFAWFPPGYSIFHYHAYETFKAVFADHSLYLTEVETQDGRVSKIITTDWIKGTKDWC